MAEYVVVDKEQLEADLTTVSDSIRGLIETEEKLEFPQGMKEAVESYSLDEELTEQDSLIEQIKTALQGKASGGSSMNEYVKYATVLRFQDLNLFGKNEVTFECDNLTTALSMFGQNVINTTVEYIEVNAPLAIESCQNMFYSPNGDECLKRITLKMDFSKCPNFTAVFANLKSLEIIDGTPLYLRSCGNLNIAFAQNKSLKEVRFVPSCISKNISFSYSSLLSDESIQSIIDGLADLTGLETQTLTFHADVKAKLTEEQIATITGKNWTLA